jgi:hypothetical protein
LLIDNAAAAAAAAPPAAAADDNDDYDDDDNDDNLDNFDYANFRYLDKKGTQIFFQCETLCPDEFRFYWPSFFPLYFSGRGGGGLKRNFTTTNKLANGIGRKLLLKEVWCWVAA